MEMFCWINVKSFYGWPEKSFSWEIGFNEVLFKEIWGLNLNFKKNQVILLDYLRF